MSSKLAEQVQNAYLGSQEASRIGLSDFSHGRKWRSDLAEKGVLEIVDRSETAGWLISDESMGSLVEHIEGLEDELEQARLEALFAARANRGSWMRGKELADAAKASAHKRRKAIEDAAHAGK